VHIGFTGTRNGMTPEQQTRVSLLLLELGATDLHHGDCTGSDDQMDQIACELGIGVCVHPPLNPLHRAWCHTRPHDADFLMYEPNPYLHRNRAIVDATEGLVATPKTMAETTRSGTWSTIRHALRRGVPVWIVRPDGSVKFRGPK
jgi:hypothetical protein